LKSAIQEFKEDRIMKNLSERTIQTYGSVMKEFQSFCALQEVLNVTDVTLNTVRKYMIYLQQERNNNPTSRNSKLHVIKVFFKHLFIEIIEAMTGFSFLLSMLCKPSYSLIVYFLPIIFRAELCDAL
ncbi:hypothetical protein GC093_11110, partial [Paenibacillus sp. LMG 31456]